MTRHVRPSCWPVILTINIVGQNRDPTVDMEYSWETHRILVITSPSRHCNKDNEQKIRNAITTTWLVHEEDSSKKKRCSCKSIYVFTVSLSFQRKVSSIRVQNGCWSKNIQRLANISLTAIYIQMTATMCHGQFWTAGKFLIESLIHKVQWVFY